MSFFGFDTTLPRDKPAAQSGPSRGIFEQHDPFAGLSRDDGADEGEMLDFEETYDGLARNLEESGDTFNDDTFGGDEPVTREGVGRDFDFAGQTARMRGELRGEQYLPQQAFQQPQGMQYRQLAIDKPKRTGYEAYKEPEYIPKLEADASIWGPSVGKAVEPPHARQESTMGRKMMSLEEVEQMMRAQSRPTPPAQNFDQQSQGLRDMLGVGVPSAAPPVAPPVAAPHDPPKPVQILQRPPQQQPAPPQQLAPQQQPAPPQQSAPPGLEPSIQQPVPDYNIRAPRILQRQHSPQHGPRPQSLDYAQQPYPMPSHQPQMPSQPPMQQSHPHGRHHSQHHHNHSHSHNRGPSYTGPPITQAQQLAHLSPQDREVYLAEEAKRAKRNHKIFLLSKNNGLMTPQDKNFITRIQLQQLLTATGGVDNEPGSEEQLAEDFYYQVYAQIRAPPPPSRPGQQNHPLNQFAQTYLFQTGSRYGYGRSRHHPRGGDNHVQRMEQQVARAVEAAKARPKNKSLVVEGSLGKIAFSNSKTPRPLLSIAIKRPESSGKPHGVPSVKDRKAALRDIEALYSVLMRLEDHERALPPPPNEESPPEVIEGHMRWRTRMQELNRALWSATKVMEAIGDDTHPPHPFIRILAHSKGKKALPRIFRHLDDQQRLTMLTLLIIHLDALDVIRDPAAAIENHTPLPAATKDEIELFSQAVMPPLFSYVNDAPLSIIIGLLGLILDRVNILPVVRTKIGLSVLTMLISRAELVAQSQAPSQTSAEDSAQWSELYTRLFDAVEPTLPFVFPPAQGEGAAGEDVYVWQFLAAMGVGASPDQQQRLVLGVKEKVMETVEGSRKMPAEVRERRLADVNLFMRSIGLDVELLS